MEETIARILTELEEINQIPNTQNQTPLISRSTLLDLHSLLSTNDPDLVSQLFDDLPSKSLSPSSLTNLLSFTMDSAPSYSILASKVYLSLLLSPNSPVFTLFTPISFLSFLRSLRRSFKNCPSAQPEESPPSHAPPNRKRKGGGRVRGARGNVRGSGDCSEEASDTFDMKQVFKVFEMLVSVLGLIHLDRFPDSLKSLVQTFGEIPLMAMEKLGNPSSFNRLMDLCSRVLSEVLRAEHGELANTAAEVLKALSPLILMVKSQARSFALGFVTKRMTELGNESDGVKKAVVNFPRYLAQKAPEKAEPRALAVDSIMEVVKVMDFEDQIGYMDYVLKMTQGKANLRLLGVDLIAMMLMSLRDPFGVDSDVKTRDYWGTKCLEALITKCSDLSAGIRARALSSLAQVVGFLSSDDRNKGILKEVMGLSEGGEERPQCGMNDLLKNRCMDDKAAVRKAALLLVTKLISLLDGCFDGILLKTVGMACSDPLVSIRKAAISALSEAFRTFSDESVTTEWLHSVPRLITDNESSIQEECENLFLELVLDRVSRAGPACAPKKGSVLPESYLTTKSLEGELELLFPGGILILLKGICDGEVTPWVKKLCTSLGKKKRLKPKIAAALQNIIKTSESIWLSHSMSIEKWTAPAGAWFLLSEVSVYLSKAVEWEFLHHHWLLLDKPGSKGKLQSPLLQGNANEDGEGVESNSVAWAGDRVFLLQTISNVSMELPAEPAADLAHNLLKRVEKFNMHSTEVNAHVKALRTLCKVKSLNPEEADQLVMRWGQQLLSKAHEILEKYISDDKEANNNSSFFTPPRSGSRKGKQAARASRLLSKTVTAVYTVGSLVVVCPAADVSSIVPLLYTVVTSGNSDPKLNKLPGPKVSLKQTAPSLYIQAWLTLGKICLADGKLAKSYIPLFVQKQELEKSDCAALRNNLVVMMADFCVRYTALVDCYIAKITKCLRDPCELVRRQTFILLSRLLQRDYVKWRGVLFLRFLLCLVDDSEKIRQLADFLFGNILKAKAPLLAYNSFIEAIYVLNDCHAHNGHNDSKNSRTESRLFSIRGNDERSRTKRMRIYVCLLKQMAPEHLLATFAKLCAEILAAASDGMLSIDDITGQSVLQDAFQILACKEIRVSSHRGAASDSAEVEEDGDSSASAAAAKGRAITQAVRKGSLMECLRVLLKDYKNEIDDMLVADKQLQKELIYDIQKYESAKARTTAAEAVAGMQNQGVYRSPPCVPKAATGAHPENKMNQKLSSDLKVASAIADAAAEATARSVLREVNKGAMTPPLKAINMPKLKSNQAGSSAKNDRSLDVLESLRRRIDDEN
ncbi:condensin-2 complex subunit D3 isoform X3 [Gossypium hirsutum]|uniref:Condensin-2 complex subunit D3 isoform X3 n=1 Tax=Gossypium hirsutum TaxID=3635 RepID=A0ABM3ATV0_GOSHI|nr:condensin-2 complex subunit D3-like isoform X3 [Gossypium hirsutum]